MTEETTTLTDDEKFLLESSRCGICAKWHPKLKVCALVAANSQAMRQVFDFHQNAVRIKEQESEGTTEFFERPELLADPTLTTDNIEVASKWAAEMRALSEAHEAANKERAEAAAARAKIAVAAPQIPADVLKRR